MQYEELPAAEKACYHGAEKIFIFLFDFVTCLCHNKALKPGRDGDKE